MDVAYLAVTFRHNFVRLCIKVIDESVLADVIDDLARIFEEVPQDQRSAGIGRRLTHEAQQAYGFNVGALRWRLPHEQTCAWACRGACAAQC